MTMLVGARKGRSSSQSSVVAGDQPRKLASIVNRFQRFVGLAATPSGRFGFCRFDTDDDDIDGPASADDLVDDRRVQDFPPARLGRFADHDLGDIVSRRVFDQRIGHRR